ncbi:hypothetical protein SAMN05421805_103462 [Saccharopolyspora antimicrobica]|uniref:Uncharacterized protein n=1 Tax=Saccharopolyspora antimicrobica TaxID=455193 RepID=A0A1I4XJ01_9PSEU|nr:hypothetical protein ATL45_2846 [Saccharopolyspora antimicrobica]SFN25712.1 hypothetical protein SAMN05421805_103462 [Saccharopolyspora antimicrobica]
MSTRKGASSGAPGARKVGVEMVTTIFSIIGGVLAVAVLLLMSISSVLPDLLERFAPRQSADEAVTRRMDRSRGSAGSAATARRSAVASVRGTGSHAVLPAGHAGSLPW